MTIKIKLTDRPVVKLTNPELYVNHTHHMQKAVAYTYNYSAVDDYIVQNWRTQTISRIAEDLNEYRNRVIYRVEVLKSVGLIANKQDRVRSKLAKEYKVLMTQAKAIKKRLEA